MVERLSLPLLTRSGSVRMECRTSPLERYMQDVRPRVAPEEKLVNHARFHCLAGGNGNGNEDIRFHSSHYSGVQQPNPVGEILP
jgi:hypothetical protein